MKQIKEGKIYSYCYKTLNTEVYRYIVKCNDDFIEYYSIHHDNDGIHFKHVTEEEPFLVEEAMQKYLEDVSDGAEAKQLFLIILFKLQ